MNRDRYTVVNGTKSKVVSVQDVTLQSLASAKMAEGQVQMYKVRYKCIFIIDVLFVPRLF